MPWPNLDNLRAEWDKLPPYKSPFYKLCPDCGCILGRGIWKYGLAKHHCNDVCPWVGWMGHTKCKGPNDSADIHRDQDRLRLGGVMTKGFVQVPQDTLKELQTGFAYILNRVKALGENPRDTHYDDYILGEMHGLAEDGVKKLKALLAGDQKTKAVVNIFAVEEDEEGDVWVLLDIPALTRPIKRFWTLKINLPPEVHQALAKGFTTLYARVNLQAENLAELGLSDWEV